MIDGYCTVNIEKTLRSEKSRDGSISLLVSSIFEVPQLEFMARHLRIRVC